MFSQLIKAPVLSRCCKIDCTQFIRNLQSCTTELRQQSLYEIPAKNRHHNQFLRIPDVDIIFRRRISYSSVLKSDVKVAEYAEIKDLPKHPEKLLIDVREPEELAETGAIPTSINIPLANVTKELGQDVSPRNFEAKYGRKKPNEKSEIIFSCKYGKRAHKAAESVLPLGYKNVKSYDGSWMDWAQHEGIKS